MPLSRLPGVILRTLPAGLAHQRRLQPLDFFFQSSHRFRHQGQITGMPDLLNPLGRKGRRFGAEIRDQSMQGVRSVLHSGRLPPVYGRAKSGKERGGVLPEKLDDLPK